MNKISEGKHNREIQTRERIMQVFLIISGFIIAYSQGSIVYIFSLFIVFALLYYIYLTRTKDNKFTNLWGFFSAYGFSLLLLVFMNQQLNEPLNERDFYSLFIVLTAIFTFAFLTPETSEKVVNVVEKFLYKHEKKHPKFIKYLFLSISVILLIFIIYRTITFYT